MIFKHSNEYLPLAGLLNDLKIPYLLKTYFKYFRKYFMAKKFAKFYITACNRSTSSNGKSLY